MTPKQELNIDMAAIEKKTIPSLTWKIQEARAEARGTVDELEAMKQAVSKILQTERYQYVIYDWN